MINTADSKNSKPNASPVKQTPQAQHEQLYITAKVDLEQKNYANQFKETMETRLPKKQLQPARRFTHKSSGLPTYSSYPMKTDTYTRKKDGFVPLTEKQKFIGK